jgi:hypothetical protein
MFSHRPGNGATKRFCLLLPFVLQLAAQLYPGHTLLQLQSTTTSKLQQAVQRALAGSSSPAVLVVFEASRTDKSNKGQKQATLVVDVVLKVTAGQSLVLATSAALQQAAAAADDGGGDVVDVHFGAEIPHLQAQQLLQVSCKGSRGGSFIDARCVCAWDAFEAADEISLHITNPAIASNAAIPRPTRAEGRASNGDVIVICSFK